MQEDKELLKKILEDKKEEVDEYEKLKETISMLELMPRKDRRKVIPKFSDTFKKKNKINNLKKIIAKREENERN